MPLARTGLIIGAVICFILSYGDFVAPYYLGGFKAADSFDSDYRHDKIRSAVASSSGRCGDDDGNSDDGRIYGGLSGVSEKMMNSRIDKIAATLLRLYIVMLFIFVFTPIVTSMVFSFNSDRFASIPLGSFTLHWYETIYNDPDVWDAAATSITVAVLVSAVSTFIGFCTAYTDFRYSFRFKNGYLILALLPPTIPLIIVALAMLAWFSRIGASGRMWSVVIAHTVLCSPFAMAVIRLRLQQMDRDLEAAAWNLGASEWAAMRYVVVPFCRPAIIAAMCLTMAVSFDEFVVAWFVSGLNKTIPVIILEILQGNVDPQINAIGTFVFVTSMTLVVIAQLLVTLRSPKRQSF